MQGSAEDPYIVTFFLEADNLISLCTCPAGENGSHCKHRIKILEGNKENIVSKNIDEIETVLSWLSGTPLEQAIKKYRETEIDFERAKAAIALAKKKLSGIMLGR